MQSVAELIVREGLTLREAAGRLGVPLTVEDATNSFRSKTFQKILRSERNRFFLEIAEDPLRTKRAAIGQLLFALEKLQEAGEYREVAEGLLKLAKIEGWLSGEATEVTIFGAGVTAKDLEDLRAKFRPKTEGSPGAGEALN